MGKSKRFSRQKFKDNLFGYAFIVPAIIFLMLIVVYPLFHNVSISFRDVTMRTFMTEQPFVGLSNYTSVLNMPMVRRAIFNTFLFTIVSLVFQFIIGFAIAILFSKKFFLNQLARGLMMVCWLIPVMVFATIWRWMFAGGEAGIINYILLNIGIIREPISWLTSPEGSMAALIISNIWRGVPFNMLLLATGLTTLSTEYFEAAEIDGASKVQQFFRITLPLLRSTIISVITLGFINTFRVFDLIWVMTRGGPLDTTHNLASVSYRLTFQNFEFGQGAAVANIMLVLLLGVGILSLLLIRKDEVN
ncbi:MAG: sugar ABC transporter permease [Defluviitaleaceae bacterium]|nr:sugar ABC transporter permease [Defluviitaleaceae bacterium]